MKHEHDYQKFDDVSLFCKRCGERLVIVEDVPKRWGTHDPFPYVPVVVPAWPPVTWQPIPWPGWTITSTSSTRLDDYQAWNGVLPPDGASQVTVANAIAGPQTATPRGVSRH